MTVSLHTSASVGEPSDRRTQDSHGRDHDKNEPVAFFPFPPVDTTDPDQSLFARDVELHENDDPGKPHSFPEDGCVM
jgi:hypothetical protein